MYQARRKLSRVLLLMFFLTLFGESLLPDCLKGLTNIFGAAPVYASSNEDTGISSVTAENHTELFIYLKSIPDVMPDALSVDVSRTVNGVPDNNFVWEGGGSRWLSAENQLIVEVPYLPNAEYTVTSKVYEQQLLDISTFTQHDFCNLNITLSETPDSNPTMASFTVKRMVNGTTEHTWDSGGTSNWDPSTNTITLMYLTLSGEYPQDSSMQYSISYLGKPWFQTQPDTISEEIHLSPIKVNSIEEVTWTSARIKLASMPEEKPTAPSVSIQRFINGEPDPTFMWNGGFSSWDDEKLILTVFRIGTVPGATYVITDNPNDELDLDIEDITFFSEKELQLHFNRRPLNEYDLDLIVQRKINNQPDNTFNYHSIYLDDTTCTLLVGDYPVVLPAAFQQNVVYHAGIGNTSEAMSEVYQILPDPKCNDISVLLDKQTLSIVLGMRAVLNAAILPLDVQNNLVTWSVLNQSGNNIVSVDQLGHVTANNLGTATVRATSRGNPEKYADCLVTVIAPELPDDEKAAIDMAALEIGYAVGDNANAVKGNLNLTVSGAVYGSSISWVSSDARFIRIDGNTGIVTRPFYTQGNQNVTLTATVRCNDATSTKDFTLTVLAREQESNQGNTGGNSGGSSGTPAATPSPRPSVTPTPTLTPAPTPVISVDVDSEKNTVNAKVSATAEKDSNGNATALITKEHIANTIAQITAQSDSSNNFAASLVIEVDVPEDTDSVETRIPGDAIQEASNSGITSLTIRNPVAEITFDQEAMKTIAGNEADEVKISAAKVDPNSLDEDIRQIVGDRPVFDFSVMRGDTPVSSFNGNVRVTVPYTLREGEDLDAIIIYFINDNGEPEIVSNCVYDPETGCVSFITNHFSRYAVGYNKVVFIDVPEDAPYYKAVNYLAARGITEGTGNGYFSPNVKLNRAQLLVLIMRAYGFTPDENADDNFIDAGNNYYTGYLAAAKRLGISKGVGNNRFAPENEISQQEMITLLYNILVVLEKLPAELSRYSLEDFADAGDIASWAFDAMKLFAENGYIGEGSNMLYPKEIADRAQMAQVLYRLLAR